jgi:hypothetical protein
MHANGLVGALAPVIFVLVLAISHLPARQACTRTISTMHLGLDSLARRHGPLARIS